MESSTAKYLRRLRARPERERRILGISVYVAIAAISIALWITSVRHAIVAIGDPPNPDDQAALPGPWKNVGREISDFTSAAGDLIAKTASLGAEFGAVRPGNPDVPVLVTTSTPTTPPSTDSASSTGSGQASLPAGQAGSPPSQGSGGQAGQAPSRPNATPSAPGATPDHAGLGAAEPARTSERSAWATFGAWISGWFDSDESYNR